MIVAISFALRAYKLGFSGFSLDEMVSLNVADNFSLLSFLSDNHPPLHILLIKLFTDALGLNEITARLPSVLASTATTAVIGLTVRRHTNSLISLVVMFLHALFPMSIIHAQLVRPYALLELASAVQFYFYLDYLHDRSKLRPLLLASLFALLSSYLSVLLFIFEFTFVQRKSRLIFLFVGMNALIIVLAVMSRELVDWSALAWQVAKYNLDSTAFLPIELLQGFIGYSYISALGLVIIFARYLKNRSPEETEQLFKTSTLFFSFLLSFIVFSLITKRAIFSERYFIFLVPLFFYLLGLFLIKQLGELKKSWLALASVALVIAGSAVSLVVRLPVKHPQWREAAMDVSLAHSSVVLTASTLALANPYFKYKNIPVFQMTPPEGLADQIRLLLDTHQAVWVVDTLWNKILNFPELEQTVQQLDLVLENHSITSPGTELVLVYKITRRP